MNEDHAYALCAGAAANMMVAGKAKMGKFPVLKNDLKPPKEPKDYLVSDIMVSDEANDALYELFVDDIDFLEAMTRYLTANKAAQSIIIATTKSVKYVNKMVTALKCMGPAPGKSPFVIIGDAPSAKKAKAAEAKVTNKDRVISTYIKEDPSMPKRQFPGYAFEVVDPGYDKSKGYWEVSERNRGYTGGAVAAVAPGGEPAPAKNDVGVILTDNSIFRAIEDGSEDEISQIVRRYGWKWTGPRA